MWLMLWGPGCEHHQVRTIANPRHITISVRYDRHPDYGRSLAWIAPELRDAGLEMTDDRVDQPTSSRSWAGVVEGRVFERFAEAWGLDGADRKARTYVLDVRPGDHQSPRLGAQVGVRSDGLHRCAPSNCSTSFRTPSRYERSSGSPAARAARRGRLTR